MSVAPQNVKEVFLAALERVTPDERAAFLDGACADDAALRQRVEALLEAHDEPGHLLEGAKAVQKPTLAQWPGPIAGDVGREPLAGAGPLVGTISEGPGSRIGPYKLLQQIGEGGMGVVYMAEQEQPVRRRVALKIIKPGMDTAEVIARFEAERQALAMMDHLHIATVLDASATDTGRPYFVMELIHGVPLTTYCDDNRLTPRERLELFVPVCHAIQHAHQKGIIHRDIKPSNVLVTMYDGKPVPKVIDFGIAKAIDQRLTDKTMFTRYGAVVGTTEYMSPEQAEMSALGVDTRSDIYSLGVLLYELLTGTTPLDRHKLRQAGFTDMIRMIKEEEPSRPSAQLSNAGTLKAVAAARKMEPAKLANLVRGELDWIVMKCLEKDRTRRYESAGGLARDVQCFLNDEPVEACPPSTAYQLRRFARKYKKGLAAVLAFVALLFLGVIVSSWQAVRATRAEEHMQAERDRALAAQNDLQLAVTRQVAERLESHLQQLETVGHSIQAALARGEDWKEDGLVEWLRELVRKDDRIHGLTLAFEPFQFDPKQKDYCLYVWRSPKGIEPDHLLPPKYVPLYREWGWYKNPLKEQRAQWSEPFFDQGGGGVLMVSYSVPFRRRGEIIGVLTVDLSINDFFKRLGGWLEELKLGHQGQRSYGFVLSGKGIFISHPDPAYQHPRTITTQGGVPADATFTELAQRILQNRKTGTGRAIDPCTGRLATFLFARVPTADWSFVAVIEQPAELPRLD